MPRILCQDGRRLFFSTLSIPLSSLPSELVHMTRFQKTISKLVIGTSRSEAKSKDRDIFSWWIILELYCSLDYCSFARLVRSIWNFAFTKFKFTGPMLTMIAFKGKPITESKLLTYIFTNPWNDVNQILIECSINSAKWIEYPGFSIKLAEQKIVSNMYRKFVRFSMKKID